MTVEKMTAELLQEREDYPFGKPRPYTPDHKNILANGLPSPPTEDIALFSSVGKFVLVFLAILAGLYGAYGLATDDLYLPGKRSPGTHYHGVAAWLIFGMILSFSGCLIAVAISKYEVARRGMTNKNWLTFLSISLICFMLAGIITDAIDP